jgi:hypothetical protein
MDINSDPTSDAEVISRFLAQIAKDDPWSPITAQAKADASRGVSSNPVGEMLSGDDACFQMNGN